MKYISLTKGYIAIVDDEDFDFVNQWKWSTIDSSPTGVCYAERGYTDKESGKIKHISMHRLIMDMIDSELTVDHIDGNGLNNQRKNLRPATKQQQAINRPLRSDNKSGHKGVYWFKSCNKWRAQIKVDGKRKSLGLYEDIEDAIKAYETAAELYYGEWRRQ